MLIDCQTCVARDIACDDCVVTVLLGAPAPPRTAPAVELDDASRAAIDQLANAGLVPPLRLVAPTTARRRDIA
ncbi:hypothetical protein SAMN05443575_2337 [Jatrophihabitans endophyticus]|uniref:Uncharacterized protein n=1 Tax=Jatrophihabitans endophyticus TaxID=1206085 RepID=A0A1M5L4U8_9ACTN|nr:hypothetical protein [Jatrophihabitans endophyticus]SHG59443.1 hypothetical protein SAMN05443575_2337 [Jatrophihabitans endophyticus]